MAWGYGLKTMPKNVWARDHWNRYVTNIDDGEYLMVRGVDFGSGAKSLDMDVACHLYGGAIEVRLDDVEGPLVANLDIENTKNEYKTFSAPVTGAAGVHDLYFVFRGCKEQKGNLFNIDAREFKK